LSRQPIEPGFGVLDGVNVILQHDLLCRMAKRTVVSQRR